MTGIELDSVIPDVIKPKMHLCYHQKIPIEEPMLNTVMFPNFLVYCRECKVFMTVGSKNTSETRGMVLNDKSLLAIANKALYEYEEREKREIEERQWTTKW